MSRYSQGQPSLLERFKKGRALRKEIGAQPSKLTEPVRLAPRFKARNAACACGREQVRCDHCGQLYCDAPGHAGHECAVTGGAA